MSAETGWALIIGGAGLAAVGMAMLWLANVRVRQRRSRAVRSRPGLFGALSCTSVACVAITGVQWAVLSQTRPGTLWAVVLWLPALLAGATVARLLATLRVVHCRRRRVRAAGRGAGR